MPREFSRSQRMAEQLRRDLAELVSVELKDPRMGFLSFTAVKLSRDLSSAVVYCSILEDDKRLETLETLSRATGFLRTELSKRFRSRTVPKLKFVNDDSVIRGSEMENLIRKAVASDKKESNENDNNNNNNNNEKN